MGQPRLPPSAPASVVCPARREPHGRASAMAWPAYCLRTRLHLLAWRLDLAPGVLPAWNWVPIEGPSHGWMWCRGGAGVVRAPADRPLRPRVDVVAWRLGSPSTVNAGNRCADRPFPRSRPTVGAEGMHSIDALVCVLLFRPDACECSFLNLLSSLQLHPSYARENAVPALRGTPTA